MTANLLGCMKLPELRDTSTLDLDLDLDDSEEDLESPLEDMSVSENDFTTMLSDTYVSCDSTEIADNGSCLDQSLPVTDLSSMCEFDSETCQDEDYNVADMNILEPPQFSNSKCIKLKRNSFLEAEGLLVRSSLGRLSNGAGADDAWTISVFIKTGENTDNLQPILHYGSDLSEQNQFGIYWSGRTNEYGRKLHLIYGTNANYLELQTPSNSIVRSSLYHLMITYDGGTTGTQNSDIEDSLSRFKIFIDGIQQELTPSHSNYGIDTPLEGAYLRVGKHPTEDDQLSGSKVDELAIWDSDESANILDIHNNGNPRDLTQLESAPTHWWRFGDGDMDRYPILEDQVGEAHFTMHNMSTAEIADF